MTMLEPHRATDEPGGNSAREESRKRLQANITKTIDKQEKYDPHYRIRKNSHVGDPLVLPEPRWNDSSDTWATYGGGFPPLTPRVLAAVPKDAWNGWGTARRFQEHNVQRTTCLLGCHLQARDSIEHYDHCRTIRTLHEELGGTKAERRLPLWLGTSRVHRRYEECNTNDAKSAYATFITTNAARRKGGFTAAEAGVIFRDAFQQAGEDKRGNRPPKSRKRRAQDPPAGEEASPEENKRTLKKRRGPSQAPSAQL